MQDEGKHGGSPEVGEAAARGHAAKAGELRTAHLWHFQPVRDLLVIAAVCVAVYAGYAMRTVTVPLLIALALAYLFDPLVTRLAARRHMNRPLAVSMILAALCAALLAGVALVVPVAVSQTLEFSQSLREGRYDGTIDRVVATVPDEYRASVRTWVDRIVHPVEEAAIQTPVDGAEAAPREATAAAPAAAEPSATSLRGTLFGLLGAGADRVWNFALAVLQLGLVAFLIPFYFYYFSVHWPSIKGFFAEMVPDESREKVFEIAADMDRAVAGFVRGRIVICTLMGVMFALGWQLCGVPYGIALGLLTGAFSIVPYLGGIGLPFAVGLLMADQFALEPADRMPIWAMLTWPTVVFLVVQTIEGYVLTPIIAGKATNLDPVTIVVAILAGGSVAGVYGMLLAIPIAACGKIAAKRLLLPRIRAWARGHAADPLPLDAD
ncbi:MAG: AI-2E family transporter [Phycisphaerales bacterium]